MKRKRMTKRIAAIILAAVMMIPTHVTSFAADASAQNNAGRRQTMLHPVIPRQHSRRIRRQRRMTAAQQVQIPMQLQPELQLHKTALLQIRRTAQQIILLQMHRTAQQIILLQMHRTARQIILLQIRRAVQQQILTAQILPPVAQPIMLQVG